VEDVPTPASRGANVVASAFAPEAFRPLLEVDRFSWPSICESLLFQAAAAFDRLTSELTMCAHSGRKRVGLASCTAGQGCTTAVLCTARQLAAQGLRCVLVDANLRNATLARQLGVAVQSGWEDVLGGEVTLGEVVVTSLEDALALVPRRLPELPGRRPESTLRAAVTFELLSEYYDLVLVDAGPASGDERLADLAACAALLRLDVVYLVCDVRQEPADRQRAAEALAKHALDVRGVVENFSVSRTRRPRLSLLRTQD
jgi:Mrp family chromosome partitioning ATPase